MQSVASLDVPLRVPGRAARAHGPWSAWRSRSAHGRAAQQCGDPRFLSTFPRGFPEKVVFSPRTVSFIFRHHVMPSGSSPLAAALGRPAVGGAYTLKVEKLS